MPELPEVETTARALRPILEGQRLTTIATSGQKLRQLVPSLAELKGHRITAIRRRAKYMLVDLDNGHTLVIHLGMSGRMKYIPTPPTDEQPAKTGAWLAVAQRKRPSLSKHDHLLLATAKGSVILHDPRRFGLVLLLKTASLPHHPLFKDLGPEPLSCREADVSSPRCSVAQAGEFTGKTLHTALATRTTPLKPTLMDAKVVVGVGNIYASESLFDAKLSPLRRANSLTLKQAATLTASIQKVLTKAINAGGSSLRDYAHPSGTLGNFQNEFCVYARRGLPCPRCATPIKQITQAQRSTFYCPTCQK